MEEKKLHMWQERLKEAENDYKDRQDAMKKREELYAGSHTIYDPAGKPLSGKATHVRNICMEIIETQVDCTIPSPKVTAVREEDTGKAEIIENMLRDVMDRLPMERINDEGERISPIQGGHGLLVSWMDSITGTGWMGEIALQLLHPRTIVPQAGVYQVTDMDWIFTKQAQTRRQIKQRFGVELEHPKEEDPDARALDAATDNTGEIVTLCGAYYRNEKGGIGRYYWVEDTQLEDMEDYQARRVYRCRKCDAVGDGKECRYCGGKKFRVEEMEFEELTEDIVTENGTIIPAMSVSRDEYGQPVMEPVQGDMSALLPQMQPAAMPMTVRYEPVMQPTRIPYYKPDVYPIVIRKNVSLPGQFFGGSDIDAIADQQNAMNKLSTKINAKVLGGGSFTTVPKGSRIATDGDNKILEISQAAELEKIRTFNTQVDCTSDLTLRSQIYEEARQTIGITDSMQGRKDPTATSAVAKEFSAQQAAGRMESKRVMKRAMYQDLFEIIFKFMLAYSDEPRQVRKTDEHGNTVYQVFDPHDFLYQDEAGAWRYNTDFLFSCTSGGALANDREALWKETRMNFESGAMGPVSEMGTLVRFWEAMEKLQYPMAGEMKKSIKDAMEEMAQQPAAQMMGTSAAGTMGTDAVTMGGAGI